MKDFKNYLRRRIDKDNTFEDLLTYPKYIEIETVNENQDLLHLELNREAIENCWLTNFNQPNNKIYEGKTILEISENVSLNFIDAIEISRISHTGRLKNMSAPWWRSISWKKTKS